MASIRSTSFGAVNTCSCRACRRCGGSRTLANDMTSGTRGRMQMLLILPTLRAGRINAQELEPHTYMPAPVGTTFVLASVGGSAGDILFDPSVNIRDAEADFRIVTTAVGYTFALAGRQARIVGVFPLGWGDVSSEIDQTVRRQDLAGLLDPRLKLSIGLRGAPALTRPVFAQMPKGSAVGTSVTVVAPLGQYSAHQSVNLGSHRWAFKPE